MVDSGRCCLSRWRELSPSYDSEDVGEPRSGGYRGPPRAVGSYCSRYCGRARSTPLPHDLSVPDPEISGGWPLTRSHPGRRRRFVWLGGAGRGDVGPFSLGSWRSPHAQTRAEVRIRWCGIRCGCRRRTGRGRCGRGIPPPFWRWCFRCGERSGAGLSGGCHGADRVTRAPLRGGLPLVGAGCSATVSCVKDPPVDLRPPLLTVTSRPAADARSSVESFVFGPTGSAQPRALS